MMSGNHTLSGKKGRGTQVDFCTEQQEICQTPKHRTEIHKSLRKTGFSNAAQTLYVLGRYSQMQIFNLFTQMIWRQVRLHKPPQLVGLP